MTANLMENNSKLAEDDVKSESKVNLESDGRLEKEANLLEAKDDIDPSNTTTALTLKRFVVLCSLTLLWISAATPIFFIASSFGRPY